MNPRFTDMIGSIGTVLRSSDPTLVGLSGEIVDETKNTIVLDCGRMKIIPKKLTLMAIGRETIELNTLRVRPEEKIKKMRRRGRI